MNFDNELERQRLKLDPQEQTVYMTCDQCGAEIYKGQDFYDCDAGYLCEDCFEKEQEMEKTSYKRIAGDDNE